MNNCIVRLVVEGHSSTLDAFASRAATLPPPPSERRSGTWEQPALFEIPAPESVLWLHALVAAPPSVVSGGPARIDEWHLRHWGTPGIVLGEPVTRERTVRRLEYRLTTVVFPPLAWAKRASRLFPGLTVEVRFRQCWNDRIGRAVFQNGHQIDGAEPDCDLTGAETAA